MKGTFQPLEGLRNWAEYAGQYKPVVLVRAKPKLRETFWSAFARGLAAGGGGYGGPARMRFKTDFYQMRLLCGQDEIQPIHPMKIAHVLDVQNIFVKVTDATYEGFYAYPPDSISPECSQVVLELYSEENPDVPKVKVLNEKTVSRVWSDFAPYRRARSASIDPSTSSSTGQRTPSDSSRP